MLLHLAWRHNLDGYDLALAVNRLATHGASLWWLGGAGAENEPGDYLCDASLELADRLAAFGIVARPWIGAIPDGAVALAAPRIALFADGAENSHGVAHYAIALCRLGFDTFLVDGAGLASGALQNADLVILPGGAMLWTIDAAANVTGADAQLRAFLGGGGAAIGSGSGAFYLSSGRPGWSHIAGVRPRYSHEHLLTGAGVVSLKLGADSIGFGCPPTIDLPYFHGPVYDEIGRMVSAAAWFDRLILPGRLFAANPLDDERFARELAGHAAILRVEGRRGRAVLFSAQPELGDLVRKYIAFDTYVPRYLATRGEAAMASALGHYRAIDAPSYRLILNAVHSLMLRRAPPRDAPRPIVPAAIEAAPSRLDALVAPALVGPGDAAGEPLARLAAGLCDDLARRLAAVSAQIGRLEEILLSCGGPALAILAIGHAGEQAAARLLNALPAAETGSTERLAAAETAIALRESWCRLATAEIHFGGDRGR